MILFDILIIYVTSIEACGSTNPERSTRRNVVPLNIPSGDTNRPENIKNKEKPNNKPTNTMAQDSGKK